MDYVKETLQRQSEAWLALFGGSGETSPEAVEEGGEPSSVRQAETEERAAKKTAESAPAETALYEAAQRLTRDETAARVLRDAVKEALSREQLVRRTSGAASALESESAAQMTGMESLGAESAHWEAEAALREGRDALETADARAISRRFERDARRYDGGFQFY